MRGEIFPPPHIRKEEGLHHLYVKQRTLSGLIMKIHLLYIDLGVSEMNSGSDRIIRM